MMAPQYEMARVLCAAINQVAGDLPDPIDRVEVKRDHLVISARSRRLTLRYYYVNSYAPDGCPMPGGGHWEVEKIDGGETTGDRGRSLARCRAIRSCCAFAACETPGGFAKAAPVGLPFRTLFSL